MQRAILLFVILGFAKATVAGGVLTAASDPGLEILSQVHGIHSLTDDKHGLSVRLFETGGGDPATNGNLLILTIVPFDPAQGAVTWKTGLDVYTVRSVTLDPDATEVNVQVNEHFKGGEGLIEERPRAYVIDYDVDAATGAPVAAIRIRARE
jgi:hypothetical protein